ncbi:hypothetical protein [Lacticaseibacillus nasuensis]|uniref:hypothetical protein n=1 Tax=Lacticaseibacillus nasuensis TaxID=944671 RepID=UPI0022453367|nr:hypothetical protein [Lacticaseibacillus nasuensis]MCX2456528.1 hypothetical protein [Lacticaseibacillus nasuensis]
MDINVNTFQTAVLAGNFETPSFTVTPAAAAKDLQAALQPAVAATVANLQAGKLSQATVTITSAEPTVIALETGVINLPFADAKKVTNFLDTTADAPLRVYLVITNPNVNASGLRIDEVATGDDFVANQAAQLVAITAAVSEKLATIEETRLAPKPTVKTAPASRTKTTKTTKTTRRTTKRASAKKTTRKRTPKKEG